MKGGRVEGITHKNNNKKNKPPPPIEWLTKGDSNPRLKASQVLGRIQASPIDERGQSYIKSSPYRVVKINPYL